MDVLDERNSRLLDGELLRELDDRLVQALTGIERMEVRGDIGAESEPEDLVTLEPPGDVLRSGAFEDPVVLPQHLSDGPVGDAVAVRQATPRPAERRLLFTRQHLPELADQSRLADTRLADDRHEVRLPVSDRAPERRPEELELAVTTHEDAVEPTHATGSRERQSAENDSTRDAVGFSLGVDRAELAELEGPADGGHGALSGEHFAWLGSLLQPRADVDGVPGHERASLTRLADDHVARVDADPQGELRAEELAQPPLHGKRSVERPLGVILLCGGCAERGHDRVPRELLDGAARPLDLVGHRLVEAIEPRADTLGILTARELRRPDEVREEDRRELPLLESDDRSPRPACRKQDRSELQPEAGRRTNRSRACAKCCQVPPSSATGRAPRRARPPRPQGPPRAHRARSRADRERGCSSRTHPPSGGSRRAAAQHR